MAQEGLQQALDNVFQKGTASNTKTKVPWSSYDMQSCAECMHQIIAYMRAGVKYLKIQVGLGVQSLLWAVHMCLVHPGHSLRVTQIGIKVGEVDLLQHKLQYRPAGACWALPLACCCDCCCLIADG